MTFRAVRVLQEADLVLAEDTRTSKKLFDHFQINTPLRAYHAHNEHQIVAQIIELLVAGQKVALISDAGTPGISDPGFLLVRACHDAEVSVTCLPGATAFTPALVVSGIPCDKFHFEGFLPHKKGRQTRLDYLAALKETFVLYESPHRLVKALTQLVAVCGEDRVGCVCRELSKVYEEVSRGTLGNLLAYYEDQAKIKGEIVIVVSGAPEQRKKEKYARKERQSDVLEE